MHNSIPEYASTVSISIVMTMAFHVMPLEKRFLKKWFSPLIPSKLQSPQDMVHRKKRKKEKKEEKGKKAPRVPSNKRGSQYFERRKIVQLQRSFLMWFYFLPLHHTISKTLSKIIEKVFLPLFGPSFSLAIYMIDPFSLPMSSTYLAFRG
jgi:hypothetical protein